MRFIKKYRYTEEEIWADVEAVIEMTEDVVLDMIENEGSGDFRIPFANDEKNKVIKYKMERGEKYAVYVYPSSGWITDNEIDKMNECNDINELIEVGFFMNIRKIEK